MDNSIPPFAQHLLKFIGDIEAPRGYETIFGNNQAKLKKPVTKMTIAEIIAVQPTWTKNYGSSATGRYQFMRATLQGLVTEMRLTGGEYLDANMQDRMGFHLLKRRGYNEFVAGKIGLVEFGKRLAQEWASLPVLADTRGAHRDVKRGQSYYSGDALNKSLVSPTTFEIALRTKLPGTVGITILPPTPPTPPPDVPLFPPSTVKAPGLFSRFVAALVARLMNRG